MIDISLLEQLLAFQECGTLSGASERLHISQPALSRSMQKLEDILDVTLFSRQKNKIALNENGLLAAEYAEKILDMEKTMVGQIRAFDRKNRTIALGSCAPIPINIFLPLLSQSHAEMTISSEIRPEDLLLRGLKDDTYQLIVLNHPIESADFYCQKWKEEHLFVTLPPAHPMASYDKLYLKDLNGQSMLLYSQIGFWHDLCCREMPDTHFLIQSEMDSLNELVNSSALPAFATDLSMENGKPLNRICVPIWDEEANVTYYCICKKKDHEMLKNFFKRI